MALGGLTQLLLSFDHDMMLYLVKSWHEGRISCAIPPESTNEYPPPIHLIYLKTQFALPTHERSESKS